MSPVRKQLEVVRAMPWGGDRNLALRELLIAGFGDVWDTHMIDGRGVVLATTRDDEASSRARVELGGDRFRRPDGTFVVQVQPSTGG